MKREVSGVTGCPVLELTSGYISLAPEGNAGITPETPDQR